ncbi:unique cartilage matrix-associated protein [Oncorhynchus mykiss]|uniref:unique cartilage matrix-associated protein n=1 Tax=Oncorhynchus mykiss TaxID=8022 RepID=UPI001877EAA4|nr:unique cartilage matrix-associated protein [Oncorhynchus mykiss]
MAIEDSNELTTLCIPTQRLSTQSFLYLFFSGPLREIFMPEADAANFFRRRSRRAAKSQDEIDAEQRQVLAADKRKRENHEEQRNEFENYAEEEHDEQDERTRESTEQWREFHYDGLHPPQEYNRQST